MWHEIGLRSQATAATGTVFMNFCAEIPIQFVEFIEYPPIIKVPLVLQQPTPNATISIMFEVISIKFW